MLASFLHPCHCKLILRCKLICNINYFIFTNRNWHALVSRLVVYHYSQNGAWDSKEPDPSRRESDPSSRESDPKESDSSSR